MTTRRRPPEKFSRLALRKRRVAVDFGLFFSPAWGSRAGAFQLGEFGRWPRLPLFSGFAFAGQRLVPPIKIRQPWPGHDAVPDLVRGRRLRRQNDLSLNLSGFRQLPALFHPVT